MAMIHVSDERENFRIIVKVISFAKWWVRQRISGSKNRGLSDKTFKKWGNGEVKCPSDRRSSRWWAIYELEKYGKNDFSPRIISETNQLTLILRSKWKLGNVKLLGTFCRSCRNKRAYVLKLLYVLQNRSLVLSYY